MTATDQNEETGYRQMPGRPKKGIKRSKILMVRLTPVEFILIEKKSKEAGLTPSEWFRKAAKFAKVVPRFSVEETGWFRTLSGLSNNLNQLTKLAHTVGLLSLVSKCREISNQVEELLTKIRKHDR